MQLRIIRSSVLVLGLAVLCAAQENPFVGTWKLNPAKSNFTGRTLKYEPGPDGAIKQTSAGLSYTFKTDGREYSTPLGRTAVWKQLNDRSWETVVKQGATTLATVRSELSPDGKTLTVVAKGTKPNGEAFEESAVYERIEGTSGLMGTWKSKDVKAGAPGVLEIAEFGKDGLKLTLVDMKATCSAKFDGKDYPATGPTVPRNLTLSLRKTGDRTFEMTQKVDGKPLATNTYTVSEDGQTLTGVGKPAAVDEPVTAVYDRQK